MDDSATDPRSTPLPHELLKTTPNGPVVEIVFPTESGRSLAPFKASRWQVLPGAWSDWDQHDVLETWFVAEGHGTVWREDVPTRVGPGDAVLMTSGVRHRLHNDGDVPTVLFSAWWPAEAARG